MSSPPPKEAKTLVDYPSVFDDNCEETPSEYEGTLNTVRHVPIDPLTAEEVEQGRREFEAKYPTIIQATRQMNAALGIRCTKPFTLPFHLPDWNGDPNVLVDKLEFHRSIQYGSTLYLKNISFFDLTPDKESGLRAKKLLCHFEAEDTVALRASFVDLSGYRGGK